MNENLRRLRRALSVFGDVFYCVTLSPYEVNLQGKFSAKVMQTAKKLRFKQNDSDNGYVELVRGCYKITLTD